MKPFPCIEHTIDFEWQEHHIRLWIDKEQIDTFYDRDIVERFKRDCSFTPFREDIINYFIQQVPNLNAIQVLDRVGKGFCYAKYGTMVYVVPFEDKK